jgi:hypothetical protein
MNVYYSGWGFIQADGKNNERVKKLSLREHRGHFILPNHVTEVFEQFGEAKVDYLLYADDKPVKVCNPVEVEAKTARLILSDKFGHPVSIKITQNGIDEDNGEFKKLRVGKLKLVDVADTEDDKVITPIPEPTNAPPVDSENLQGLSVGDLENQPTDSNNHVIKNNKVNNNDFEPSGLLNTPKKQDDWFEVIDKMTKKFHEKYGAIPTSTQAFDSLCNTPLAGYTIKVSDEIKIKKNGGKNSVVYLNMSGKKLSRDAFMQRWLKRYTKQSQNRQT